MIMIMIIMYNFNSFISNNIVIIIANFLLSRILRFKRDRERKSGEGQRGIVLPNGPTRDPQCFVLLLLYLGLYLVSYQHQVGPGVDGV